MTTLPNMSLVLPTRGALGSGLWADALDAALGLLDEHDHTPGKGPRVPILGLDVNDDLSLTGAHALTDAHHVKLFPVALFSDAGSVFINQADNNLYFQNSVGTNIKITDGNILNVAGFAGSIGGDYTAVSAALNFDSGGNRYTLRGAGGTTWARMASGEVRLFETGSTDAVFVGHAAPTALAGSYTVTWPLALPGAQALVQVEADGDVVFSNTVPGNLTVQGTLSRPEPLTFHPSLGVLGAGATYTMGGVVAGLPGSIELGTGTDRNANLPLILREGSTLTSWNVRINKRSSTGTVSVKLVESSSSGSVAQLGATQSNSANAPGAIDLGQTGLSVSIVSGRRYFIEVTGGGSTTPAGDQVFGYSASAT